MKNRDIMYNLNINLAETATNALNTLMVENTGTTPKTPEILNSIVAMTNPLETMFSNEKKVSNGPLTNLSTDSNSSSSSQIESPTTNPPSVQHTCSQLIKAGLKLSIEQKRKHQSDGEDLLDLDKIKRIKRNESESEDDRFKQETGLTPEDEERRRRRRERNKIAATKCRLKKRERTSNLMVESETLEAQNIELKKQRQELETERQTLLDILNTHRPHCPHNIGPASRDVVYRLPPVNSVMEAHSYSRPASVDTNYRNQNFETYNRPASVGIGNPNLNFMRSSPSIQYKAPNIIVEDISETYEFTNLDDMSTYNYNTQCHNYSSGSPNYNNSGMDNGCMA